MSDLKGRVALVTGGGRGIGRAIALALAEAGADVAINYRRDEEAAKATAEDMTRLGVNARAHHASVDNVEDCRMLVDSVVSDLGGLSIVVNCAGIASRGNSVADTDPAELERVLRVHAMGPHHVTQAALPHLREADRGDVVFISSVAAHTYGANGAPYNMGKAAMEALSRTLAREERKNGIHVNIVAPGLVDTEMGRRLIRATAGVQNIRDHDPNSPFGHVCTPEEIAETVRFVVTAGYVNDQRIVVDGGTF